MPLAIRTQGETPALHGRRVALQSCMWSAVGLRGAGARGLRGAAQQKHFQDEVAGMG